MPSTKIRKDSRSLYVRTNGTLYRPIANTDFDATLYAPLAENIISDGASKLKAGAKADLKHVLYTPLIQVTSEGVTEIWQSHGCYTDDNGLFLKSDTVFRGR